MSKQILTQPERKIEKGKLGGWRPNSGRKPVPLKKRILYSVDEETGCWIWSGNKCKRMGYGRVSHKGRYIGAHRGSYLVHVGDVPDGLCVLHKCDNPSCVNPDHLFLGTYQDNTNDAIKKNRHCKGEGQHLAKLTEDKVRLIRKDKRPIREIAEEYMVNYYTIAKVIKRETWKHV